MGRKEIPVVIAVVFNLPSKYRADGKSPNAEPPESSE